MAVDPTSAAAAYANAARHQAAGEIGTAVQSGSTSGPNFAEFVQDALSEAVATGHKAEQVAVDAASGDADIVEVVSVRDRMVSAYQEIMRMPI